MVCGYSLFTNCSFDNNKNKHDFWRGEDSMTNWCVNAATCRWGEWIIHQSICQICITEFDDDDA